MQLKVCVLMSADGICSRDTLLFCWLRLVEMEESKEGNERKRFGTALSRAYEVWHLVLKRRSESVFRGLSVSMSILLKFYKA
jgi:hypothetical protein